jgi:hypothetical protein
MRKIVAIFIILTLSSCSVSKHNSVKRAVDKTMQELIAKKVIN